MFMRTHLTEIKWLLVILDLQLDYFMKCNKQIVNTALKGSLNYVVM